MRDVLIVDGYNIIFAWPELEALRDQDMGHARTKLVEILADYSAFVGQRTIVVFDGHSAAGAGGEEIVYGIEVVFTRSGETADSCIEKMTYLLRQSGWRVYVATSDWAEQAVVFGSGAYRIPARELRVLVQEAAAQRQEYYHNGGLASRRHDLESRVKNDVLARLREWRRGR